MIDYYGIPYEAFGQEGAFIRDARIIGELPNAMRMRACEDATEGVNDLLQIVAQERVAYGTPIYLAYGMTRADASSNPLASVLLLNGEALPLTYCTLNRVRADDYVVL
jgi:hypothetical protein